jgi:molybdopterin/thiamine biosynthesis adenylyltransferase
MVVDEGAIRCIEESKEVHLAPNGEEYFGISLEAVRLVAQEKGTSVKEVEIAALEKGIVPRRYHRNIGTIGQEGQIGLLRSTVAVVGAGGLGGGIIELLARQGIGNIIIIDSDRFTEEDLNRQLMSTEDALGEYKAIIAARRVKEINSAVTTIPYTERITPENVLGLIKGASVVVDGLDNLPSRFIVEGAARDLGIPFVYGAIAGFSGQLMTIFPEDEGLSSIYGLPADLPVQGVEVEIGNPSATPTMIAAWQVQEVIKVITGISKPLRNRLFRLDAEEGTAEVIELKPGALGKDTYSSISIRWEVYKRENGGFLYPFACRP